MIVGNEQEGEIFFYLVKARGRTNFQGKII